MADAYVSVKEGADKKMQTYRNTVDGQSVDAEAFVPVDSSGAPINPALESGGNLATVKTNTDPLVASGGGGYVRQDSTGTIAKETGGNLATVKTNTDPLVAAAGGGYIRQDSTATIAKESGGNLATVKTNTDPLVTAAGGGYIRQDSTATIAKESGGNLAAIKTDADYLPPATSIGTLADVTAAASATQVTASSTPCKAVVVRALAANTGVIRVGNVDVTASRGKELSAGDDVVLAVNNVNLVYIFGNASDKVSISYVN